MGKKEENIGYAWLMDDLCNPKAKNDIFIPSEIAKYMSCIECA